MLSEGLLQKGDVCNFSCIEFVDGTTSMIAWTHTHTRDKGEEGRRKMKDVVRESRETERIKTSKDGTLTLR